MHTSGNDLQRVLHKFAEKDYVKIERLVELLEKNLERMKGRYTLLTKVYMVYNP